MEGESYTCAVCLDDLTDAAARRVLRVCAHAFCADCVERLVADAEEAKREREGSAGVGGGLGASASCPLCRTLFTSAAIFSALEISNASSAADPVPDQEGAGGEPGAGAEDSDGPKQECLLGSPEARGVGMGGREEGAEGRVDGGEESEAGGEERVKERGQSVSPKIHALIADLEEAIENAGAHGRGANMSSVGGRTEDHRGGGEGRAAAEEGRCVVGVGGGGAI